MLLYYNKDIWKQSQYYTAIQPYWIEIMKEEQVCNSIFWISFWQYSPPPYRPKKSQSPLKAIFWESKSAFHRLEGRTPCFYLTKTENKTKNLYNSSHNIALSKGAIFCQKKLIFCKKKKLISAKLRGSWYFKVYFL